jgi:hypothetical protein
MAHLEVEPRPKRPNWLWALLIIIAILLSFTLFKYCNQGTTPSADDPTTLTTSKQVI